MRDDFETTASIHCRTYEHGLWKQRKPSKWERREKRKTKLKENLIDKKTRTFIKKQMKQNITPFSFILLFAIFPCCGIQFTILNVCISHTYYMEKNKLLFWVFLEYFSDMNKFLTFFYMAPEEFVVLNFFDIIIQGVHIQQHSEIKHFIFNRPSRSWPPRPDKRERETETRQLSQISIIEPYVRVAFDSYIMILTPSRAYEVTHA